MYCNNCGEKIREGAAFCPVCGERIVSKGRSEKAGAGNNIEKSFEINAENIKTKAGETLLDISDAAKEVKDKTAEKIENFDASEKIEAAKKGTRNFFDWYGYNWNRLFKHKWNGIELKHHLIWGGAHVAALLLIIFIINPLKGVSKDEERADKVGYENIESENAEESKNFTQIVTDVVSQGQNDGNETEDAEEKSAVDQAVDAAKEKANEIGNELDYAAKVLFSSLYGTWTNESGTFTLTIGKDGTVKIADSTGTFGADAFTYTEVDDDTVRLKVASDSFIASMLSIDMDYEVNGETLTVSALNQSFDLKRKK